MKIALLQEKGYHQVNLNYREALCLSNGFERLGHECIVWGNNYDIFHKMSFYELEKWCDIIFVVENYYYDWIPHDQINNSKKLKLFWTIDSHVTFARHENFTNRIQFNHIFTATKKFIDQYKNCSWLPNCYPDYLCKPDKSIAKNTRLGFCGSPLANRLELINKLTEKYNLKQDFHVLGDYMVQTINSYKLHFNRNINYDINYRTFETTGCATALITNYTDNLEELFDLDRDLLVYRDENELYSILDKYLYDDNKLQTVAQNGYNNSSNNHTYYNRCNTILETIK